MKLQPRTAVDLDAHDLEHVRVTLDDLRRSVDNQLAAWIRCTEGSQRQHDLRIRRGQRLDDDVVEREEVQHRVIENAHPRHFWIDIEVSDLKTSLIFWRLLR